MGEPRPPVHAKLFIGMLSSDASMFETCSEILQAEFGPIDLESGISPWTFTDYYAREMGDALFRKFAFFGTLIDPGVLAAIKTFTNKIELDTAIKTPSGYKRAINLDPGYVTEAKVVLASTKDYSHRVYIGRGIYAEVALHFRNRTFSPTDHAYPDYRTKDAAALFNKARDILRTCLKSRGSSP